MNIDLTKLVREETAGLSALVDWIVLAQLEKDRNAIRAQWPAVRQVGLGVTTDHDVVYLVTLPLPLKFETDPRDPGSYRQLSDLPENDSHFRGCKVFACPGDTSENTVHPLTRALLTATEPSGYGPVEFLDVVRQANGEHDYQGYDPMPYDPEIKLAHFWALPALKLP